MTPPTTVPLPPAPVLTAPAVPTVPTRDPARPTTWAVGSLSYTQPGLTSLFFWLLGGDFAWSMRERSVLPMAQWYLHHLGVDNLLFSLLTASFPALLGLLLGPIISVRSDRHRGPHGRRIPYLLVTTPLAALGMIGLGLAPVLAGRLGGEGTTAALWCFGVAWTVFEFAAIISGSVFGGLINDVVPPLLLGRFYGLFRAMSLLAGMIFNYLIFGHVAEHYTLFICTIAVFYGVAFLVMCTRVREGEYPPPPPAPPPAPLPIRARAEVRLYVRECFTSPYYVLVFLLLTISGLAFVPVNTFSLPFAASVGVDTAVYGKFIALTYAISLGLSYFLGWLCDRFHPLRVVLATLLGYAAVAVCGGLLATSARGFLSAWVLHGVLSGCYYTAVASLAQRLFPKLRFATFASAAGVLNALVNMTAAPLLGAIIDRAGNAYRLTFAVGAVLALAAVALGLVVYRRFLALGGPDRYVAPEPIFLPLSP